MASKGDGATSSMNICLLMFMWTESNCYPSAFVWVVESIQAHYDVHHYYIVEGCVQL